MSTRAKMPSISEDEAAAAQQQHHHLLAGLSQLSCSTGNNEGFTLNRTDEEKSETRKSEAPSDDCVSMRSQAAQTTRVDGMMNPSTTTSNPPTYGQKSFQVGQPTWRNRPASGAAQIGNNSPTVRSQSKVQPPMPFSDVSAAQQYPMITTGMNGVITLILAPKCYLEMSVDKCLHIVAPDKFAITLNTKGTSNVVQHPRAKIVHCDQNICARFTAENDKMAVFDTYGVLFTMAHLAQGYLISSSQNVQQYRAPVIVPIDVKQFATMNGDRDWATWSFYTESQTGPTQVELCREIVNQAVIESRSADGSYAVRVHDIRIDCFPDGEITINARPRQVCCNWKTGLVALRTPSIDIAIEEDEKAYVKKGLKRVHVSCSGMVVSDGNIVASTDQRGRIISA
ncbi:unnamed protein product, partial [Mesorhabditis spiculigera]